MSAWYLFSALGFYPVNPASAKYVVGAYVYSCYPNQPNQTDATKSSPFFDKVTIDLPGSPGKPLVITSKGAPKNKYVRGLKIGGQPLSAPIISHNQIVQGGEVSFEMSGQPEPWGSGEHLEGKGEAEQQVFRTEL